jgi:hypothetical protein
LYFHLRKNGFLYLALFMAVACQAPPSTVVEFDQNLTRRQFEKIDFGNEKLDYQRAIVIDVRSRFDFEMSRLPRSFHALDSDWDLSSYSGHELDKKRQQLQRLLALKGVEPLTQVVIFGYGLSGYGEEFLLATTLFSLGVERIQFLSLKQARDSMISKEQSNEVPNAPHWDKPLSRLFHCEDRQSNQSADVVIGNANNQISARRIFTEPLGLQRTNFPKPLQLRISSPKSYWAYGLALHLLKRGQNACVVETK